jgi:hypothetical protein
MEPINAKANYIWSEDNHSLNQHILIYKKIHLHTVLASVPEIIAVNTKYWLYINGNQAVFEGGLFRESMPDCGHVDYIDLAPYLLKGETIITIACWYFGNGGCNIGFNANLDSDYVYYPNDYDMLPNSVVRNDTNNHTLYKRLVSLIRKYAYQKTAVEKENNTHILIFPYAMQALNYSKLIAPKNTVINSS